MKSALRTILFFFIGLCGCVAQDTATVLSVKMFDNFQVIRLPSLKGWIYREGNDTLWAAKNVDLTGWRKLKPVELSSKNADKTGRVEGWFRFKFKLDDSFGDQPLGFKRGTWAATDIYVDGNFIASFGATSKVNDHEYNPIAKPSVPMNLKTGIEHIIAIHFVDHTSPFPVWQLKSETVGGTFFETTQGLGSLLSITGPNYNSDLRKSSERRLFYRTFWLSATTLLSLLFWMLALQNRGERNLTSIAIFSSFFALQNLPRFFFTDPEASFNAFWVAHTMYQLSYWVIEVMLLVVVTNILNFQISPKYNLILAISSILIAFMAVFDFFFSLLYVTAVLSFFIYAYVLFSSWRKIKGAQWAIVAGLSSTVLFATFMIGRELYTFSILTGFYLSLPLSLIVYVSLRFREVINEVRENARQVVQMTEEKKEYAVKQRAILEGEVARQTSELRTTLENLKSTQAQLIQSEKMASLGELTAGIAHEIQNPLNFVNNFSEVNNELIDELKSELESGNQQLAKGIANDIKNNLEKINHHGKRADSIVKGMLQHSRNSSGHKELTDINVLCEEFLRLSYHGLRAKDKSFNVKFQTDFDSTLPKIKCIPQDIGRVVLNLINNAFYAVNERSKHEASAFEPQVSVATKNLGDRIEIKVKDNGTGIPDHIKEKIFQPFFTTKPTGQGTGLGLSLSYDIVKAHGGELNTETMEGEGTTFIVHFQSM